MDTLLRLLHVVPTLGHIHLPPGILDRFGKFDALLVSGLDGGHSEVLRELDELRPALELTREQVFIVPGPFDVDRVATRMDKNIERLVTAVREGREKLDNVFSDVGDMGLLACRFASFLAQRNALSLPGPLFWSRTMLSRDQTTKVSVLGLNSVLVSTTIPEDHGRLALGMGQVAPALLDGPDVILALSFYPFGGGWFQDGGRVASWVTTRPRTGMFAADMERLKAHEPIHATVHALVKSDRGIHLVREEG